MKIAHSAFFEKKQKSFKIFFREMLKEIDDVIYIDPTVQEVLTKEYQYKNSYQGKYCDPLNIYRL